MTMVMGIWGAGPLPVFHQEWHRNHLVCVSPADGYTTALVTVYGIGRTFRFGITMDEYRSLGLPGVRNRIDASLAEIDLVSVKEDQPFPAAAPDAQ
jgi:hypothetical protein